MERLQMIFIAAGTCFLLGCMGQSRSYNTTQHRATHKSNSFNKTSVANTFTPWHNRSLTSQNRNFYSDVLNVNVSKEYPARKHQSDENNEDKQIQQTSKNVLSTEKSTDQQYSHLLSDSFKTLGVSDNRYKRTTESSFDDMDDVTDEDEEQMMLEYVIERLLERRKREYPNYDSADDYTDDDDDIIESLAQSGWLYDEYVKDDTMQDDFMRSPKSKTGRVKFKPPSGSAIRNKKRRQASNEYKIKRLLLRSYDITSRPVMNDSTTVTVSVGMSLFHILDTNEKMQTLSALIAIRLRWMDEYMTWDPDDYGGVDTIWVPAMQIWTPDIFINNFADESFQDFMNTYAIIQSTGEVLWMFPAVIKTYCTLDVRHFPFDRQKCDIVFISWTFNGFKVNMTYNESEHSAVYYKPKNQEWFVDEVGAARQEKIYACCPEPYPDVTFTIFMTRRSLFYIINLIFPCLLIYTVSFLGFFLPVESGEKVNLEITILLALVVFLLMVGETLPPTPDAIPALGLLFGTTMLMVSIALVMSVIVTNLYLRKDWGERVPYCVRKIFLQSDNTRRDQLNVHVCDDRRYSAVENHIGDNHTNSKCAYPQTEVEMDNLSVYSEQETPFCTTSRCRRRKSKKNKLPYQTSDPEQMVWSLEWQMLAKCVDRIFFWLFLFASIAALSSIFISIPQHDNSV